MLAVCWMVLVDDNIHYPLIPSNPLCDLSELIFKVFKNPRENAVFLEGNKTKTEHDKETGQISFRYLLIV